MTELVRYQKASRQPSLSRRVAAGVSVALVAAVVASAPLSVQQAAYAEVVPLARGQVMNQELMAKATAAAEFQLPALEISELPLPEPEPATGGGQRGAAWAPPAGVPDPGSAQAIARGYVPDDREYSCLVALWNRESHWNVYAHNTSSGAYGIPQSLPGHKMASAGADWQTNPDTQIRWGLGYIQGRYGSPCAAWGHSEAVGWY